MTASRVAAVTVLLAAALAAGATAHPAAAQVQALDLQLQEIRTLIREKRYPLALESLRLVARQVQDLRLEAVAPAFPTAPAGWSAAPALSLLEEDEIWTDRVIAHRVYDAATGFARMDLTIDINSPYGPAAALAFNPLALNADPQARLVDVGSEKGLLRYAPDTGEAQLRVLLGRDVLVTARGRGLKTPETLIDLAKGVDFAQLRRAGR
jgi:hypothetical protein